MTGRLIAECGIRNADISFVSRISRSLRFRNPNSTIRIQRGFSLLELMIALSIIIILLSIAVPTYQRAVRQAREVVLKENLFQMRRSIDQFRSDKGKLPQSVDDLVSEKYLREKPIDPILEKAEWNEIQGDDTNSADGEQGLVDVKSNAEGEDTEGVAFSEY
ncbi:MAG: prepilin-type N-terminal cleavage/methylation domain-containing protein [Pyrinomonadaceae bacterium]